MTGRANSAPPAAVLHAPPVSFRLACQVSISAIPIANIMTNAVDQASGSRPNEESHRIRRNAATWPKKVMILRARSNFGEDKDERVPETTARPRPRKNSQRLPRHMRVKATASNAKPSANFMQEFFMRSVMHNAPVQDHKAGAPAHRLSTRAPSPHSLHAGLWAACSSSSSSRSNSCCFSGLSITSSLRRTTDRSVSRLRSTRGTLAPKLPSAVGGGEDQSTSSSWTVSKR